MAIISNHNIHPHNAPPEPLPATSITSPDRKCRRSEGSALRAATSADVDGAGIRRGSSPALGPVPL